MAATKDQLISDLILRISGGKPSDDLELERSQVAFWLSQAGNSVVKLYIEKKLSEGEPIDNFLLEKLEEKPLLEESVLVGDDSARIYIILPKEPIDLVDDSGVVRVRTSEGSRVNKTTVGELDMITEMEFCKPSVENLVYYRENKKIYLVGIPQSMVPEIGIHVWYVPKLDLECLSETDVVKIPDDLIVTVMETAEQIGRRQTYGPQDLENDGQQDLKVQ